VQYALRDTIGYQWAIAAFEIVTILTLALLLFFGQEAHNRSFTRDPAVSASSGEP
jgi:hypothetical protein